MKHGPDIARVAALIGDPARANMLTALMSGKALTAGELAREAGIGAATASGHLSKLTDGGLLIPRKQGRHRYFQLADEEVGRTLEALAGLSASKGHLRTRTGPKDPALRNARICYDHLAGSVAVALFERMAAAGTLSVQGEGVTLTEKGADFVRRLGIAPEDLASPRRPMCRICLDWSERRSHLAGALGAAMLTRFLEAGWMERAPDARALRITRPGREALKAHFGITV